MINTLFWRVAGLSLACSAVLLPLLLALRLILPFPIAQSQQAVTVEIPRYEIVLDSQTHTAPQADPAKSQPPMSIGNAAAHTVLLTGLLPGVWLLGMIGCSLWLVLFYALARRALLEKARSDSPEEEALLGELSRELGCRSCPALYRSDRVSTPMLMGLLRPVVLMPAGELDKGELSVMLRHELTHLRRRDVAYKLLLQLTCILHWFNPLVWWMGREAGRNLELCCDEDVVRGRDGTFRRAYGEILLKAAAGTGRASALSARMGGCKGHLKARLNNLFIKKKNSGALVCAVLAAAILGGTLVSCTGETPEQGIRNDGWKANVTSLNDTQDAIEKMESAINAAAIHELADSIEVTRSGVVLFTIPPLPVTGEDEWQIEIKGRAEFDGFGGMSLHYPFDPVELVPGVRYTYDLLEEWPGIKELYLSVARGSESMDIDLLALVPAE